MTYNQSLDELLAHLRARQQDVPLDDWSQCQLHYLEGCWAELLPICTEHYADHDPLFLIGYLRARAELGDIGGLIEEFEQHWPRIERLPPFHRQLYFVMVFAFTGQTALVERAAQSYREGSDPFSYEFWLATAHIVAGNRGAAAPLLEVIVENGDGVWRARVRQRQQHPPAARPQLSHKAQALLLAIEECWKCVPWLK